MIQTDHLTKRYGNLIAVNALNLHVRPGEVYGLLGPNGAGKTTTLLMLLGILPPTSGSIRLFGLPLTPGNYFAIKRQVGVVGERQHFDDDMTAREYLRFFADLYAVENANERIDGLMEAVGLSDSLDTRTRDYLEGMKQKLAFVRALVPDPELLILDEPVRGLVPSDIHQVRQLVQAQKQAGKTVLISSQVLSEVERIAHRVGIVHHGRLLSEDTIAGLDARLADEQHIDLELADPCPNLPQALTRLPFVQAVDSPEGGGDRRFTAHLTGETDLRAELSRAVTAQGGVIVAMQPREVCQAEASVIVTEQDIPRLVGQGKERKTA
jgi:ABC-2 type transport system ATP-binding protein